MSRSSLRTVRQPRRHEKRPPSVPKPDRPAPDGGSLDAPLERILFVLTRLREKKPTTATTLMRQFEISRSTATRDIEYMRSRLDMPITWDAIQGTYVLTGSYDHLPFVVLGTQDALALALAGRVCEMFHGSAFGRRMDAILKKLAPMLGGAVSVAVDSLEHVHTPECAEASDELELVLEILEAIAARQNLRFEYVKLDASAPSRRCVHPLHLVRLEDRWRLIAQDTSDGNVRHFRLSRMRHVKRTDAVFTWPENFDPREHLKGTLGAFAGNQEHEVRITLDAQAAAYARERPWHASQQLVPRANGGAEITLRVTDLPGVKNLALRWAEHVEVTAPEELRAEIKTALNAAAARYA